MSRITEPAFAHRLQNQLTIVLGFADLLLTGMSEEDPRRLDALEIQKAARHALDLLREIPQPRDAVTFGSDE